MKKCINYFFLQLKRCMRFLPFVLIISLLLCAGLGILMNFIFVANGNSEENKKITIGAVGDTDSSYLSFGLEAIKTFDSSRFSVNIVEMSEEAARRALERGEISAYIIIPEGFVDDMVNGEVGTISYVSSDGAVNIASLFKEEVTHMISDFAVYSQKGIFGLYDLLYESDIRSDSSYYDKLTLKYFSLILGRTSMINTKNIGVSDSLSFVGYMCCGIVIFLMLLCGICACPLFIRTDMSLPRVLSASRRGAFLQISGEYFGYFCMMLCNFAAIFIAVMLIAEDSLTLIPEFESFSRRELFRLSVKLIPAVLVICALQFFLFEVSSGVVGGVLLQFVSAISLGYISGCFYPSSFFPRTIQTVARFTPPDVARRYMGKLLLAGDASAEMLTLIVMFCLLFFASVLVRLYRIRKQ